MATPSPVTALPGTQAEAVTPSDSVTFEPSLIYVGGAGNVNVLPAHQAGMTTTTPVLFTAPPVGSVLPVRVIRVLSTSTTATALVRIY